MSKKTMTLNEVATKCANDILKSKNAIETIKSARVYINNLQNSQTGEKISQKSKGTIVKEIITLVEKNKNIIMESDNGNYLDVVDLISRMLGSDKDE